MAAGVRWQTSGPATRSGNDAPAATDDSVETLLRRLIRRIEESERRYAEALDELHTRVGHVSQTAGATHAFASPEESETLERLRHQLSGLARRLEQPEPQVEPVPARAQPLDKAREEVRAVSAGLAAADPDWFQWRSATGPRREPEGSSFRLASEPRPTGHPLDIQFSGESSSDSDRRLLEMAQRLERSIGEAMPSAAIDSLNARMDEIAARFDAALAETPKMENLKHLERQIADMGQQLGRVEQDVARIGAIEERLQRLVTCSEAAPIEMERAAERGASKIAQETARLVTEASAGKPNAADRLDALRRDIVAMNERSLATDDRLVDTLAAMHESVKGLVQQKERERAMAATEPRPVPVMEARQPQEPASYAPPQTPPQAADPPRRNAGFVREAPFESTEDLVSAARRAAQAAAMRAEQRESLRRRTAALAEKPGRAAAEPGLHKMSLLMVVAAVLLMISAALLFTRLKSKPDLEAPAPAAAQSSPAPAAEAAPLSNLPYRSDATPNGEVAPVPPADARPAPKAMGISPPVRLGGADRATVSPAAASMLMPGVSVLLTELN
jgi:localization factor PodJL